MNWSFGSCYSMKIILIVFLFFFNSVTVNVTNKSFELWLQMKLLCVRPAVLPNNVRCDDRIYCEVGDPLKKASFFFSSFFSVLLIRTENFQSWLINYSRCGSPRGERTMMEPFYFLFFVHSLKNQSIELDYPWRLTTKQIWTNSFF